MSSAISPKKKPRARKLERDRATDSTKATSSRHAAAKAAAKKSAAPAKGKKAAPRTSRTRDEATDRPARAGSRDRVPFTESRDSDRRPSRGTDSRDSRSDSRGSRDDRPSRSSDSRGYGSRDSRDDRPSRGYDSRDSRGSRDDRPARSYDSRSDSRGSRDDRPSRDGDSRPRRSFEGFDKAPARPRRTPAPGERPRGGTRDGSARTYVDVDPRSKRDRDRDSFDRPARTSSRSDFSDRRPARRDSFDEPRSSRTSSRDTGSRGFSSRIDDDEDLFEQPLAAMSSKKKTVSDPNLSQTDATWVELGVDPRLAKVLASQGITSPFPIQEATLPDSISGRDVLGRGQTGSGKTLAFGLATLTRLADRKGVAKHPLALILVPTRELAMQVNDALTPLAHAVGLDTRLIAGGMPYAKQIDALRRGVQILVSTPGRLTDLVNQGHADLSKVEIAILDEADQMSDMGFMPQVVDIMDYVKPEGQRLLFSATLDKAVDKLVRKYLTNPIEHATDENRASVTTMKHYLLVVQREDKNEVIEQIAAREGKVMLFVRTQAAADRIAGDLARAGVPVGSLHGGKSQAQRTRTLNAFREGRTNALVATDVAARGIHVDDVSLVVHIDPPTDHKDYLHRAGRTARAGESGAVVTLIGPRQQRSVGQMMNRASVDPEIVRVHPMSADLVDITGAQEPTGEPWTEPAAPRGGRPAGRRPQGGGGGRGGSRGGYGDSRGGSRGGERGGERRSGGGRSR